MYATDATSSNIWPPPYTNGTPNESVANVFVLMSILGTQYFGNDIVIMAPDLDNFLILQVALTGADLRRQAIFVIALT